MLNSKENVASNLFTYQNLVHAIAGATGSVVAMGTLFPLDTVRSRLQLDEDREAKNTLAVLHELVEKEGFGTLYRGMVPVLQSLCASNFVYFYTFHGLKARFSQSAGQDLFLASIAGVVNVLITTPFWVVNTRLKMKGVHVANHGENSLPNTNYIGLFDGLRKIASQEGICQLWSGTLPSLILVANPALQFMTYETVKRYMQSAYQQQEFGSAIYFLIGALSKAVATVVTYPLQLIQTKLRHGHNFKDLPPNAGMIHLIMYILRKRGVKGLFKGMEAKILQTILTAALMFTIYEKIISFVFKLLLNTSHK